MCGHALLLAGPSVHTADILKVRNNKVATVLVAGCTSSELLFWYFGLMIP